ncbi:hypothetical protein Mgra_00009050 [Meloidogyne graminicola]|uniref:Uncharacterized protein n=1 Tax=Meloidogyne graminicola TaxID=189291 RepID=A0A8S9ZDX6_9BILA|nr:hypothetical protein Mgra_00009050 [Meloidogyne graminicola]
MSNPQYMLQLLALMGYSTENSLNIGMNSLFAVPSSSSSATYNAALQNQQLQTLLALSSLSGSTDLNNAINSSYLSAALVSMLGTNCPSVNIGGLKIFYRINF